VHKCSSINCNPKNIIKYPIINGKSKKLLINNKYTFNVSLLANKSIIKKSIEYLFNVKVIKINTQITLKKNVKLKKYYKKAIITLKNKNEINLFIKH
jgi:large subunit ribosomal protein L23